MRICLTRRCASILVAGSNREFLFRSSRARAKSNDIPGNHCRFVRRSGGRPKTRTTARGLLELFS